MCREKTINRCKELFSKTNKYDLSGEYGIGYDSNGQKFYFDLEDYDKIKDYCWYVDPYGYVTTIDRKINKRIRMHRIIMGVFDENIDVDHKNGSDTTTDNRKYNLRIATRSQNNMNKSIMRTNTSGVTGVSWHKNYGKWRSYIKKNGKQIDLGYYDDFDEAVKVRKEAEKFYFGKWSYDESRGVNVTR